MDYKKMYHGLFNAVTDAINILQDAQRLTEEMYIEDAGRPNLSVFPPAPAEPDEPHGGTTMT